MKTIILSGGLGYRLKEETEFKPKPMVHVGGKPMLWHIMKIYAHYGFNDFIIALGYKGDYIKEYFLNQKHFAYDFTIHTKSGYSKLHKNKNEKHIDDFTITFVDTGEDTLPGERILRVQKYIPEGQDFMVTYGDGVADINIKDLVKFHKKQNTVGTVTGVHPRSKYGLLQTDADTNIVKKFIEKPVLRAEWVNGGFMIFRHDFFKYLRDGEMEHEAIRRLIDKKQLSLFVHEGFWHSMDTYSDVNTLNDLWSSDPPWKVWTQ